MSSGVTIRAKFDENGKVVQVLDDGTTRPFPESDRTDWARVDAMTEEEIEQNALDDPDNPPLTEEELARFRPVSPIFHARVVLDLTQEQFAEQFRLPLATVRDWEQGRRKPGAAALAYLQLIKHDPRGVRAAINATAPINPEDVAMNYGRGADDRASRNDRTSQANDPKTTKPKAKPRAGDRAARR